MKLHPRLLPGLAILLAACASRPPSPPVARPAAAVQEEAEAEARAADLAFSAAAVGHDTSAFAAFLEADAVFVSPGSVDVGARSVCAGWAPLLAPGGPTLAWSPDFGLATGSGDLVLTRGAYTFTPADGGPPRTGRYLTVWRRRPDGRLAVALDASDTPLPAGSARAARRSLRRLLSADGRLGATAGLLLDGEREVGGYVLVEVREGDGWRVLAEVGDWRPG